MTQIDVASRQTQRYETKREAILDAAAELFNQRGLKGVTVVDVAQAVGLSATSVTYYYRRKEDIAAACLMRTVDMLAAVLERAQVEPTPADRIARYLELYFETLSDIATGRRAEPISFTDIRALTGPQVETVTEAFNDLFRGFRALLRPVEGSPFGRAEENGRAHLFFSLTLWARTWLRRYDPADYPRAARRMADIVINGLAPLGASWTAAAGPAADTDPPERSALSQASYLRAVTRLINDHGYHGASVDKISAQLNVTKGSFYHHNETKDDAVVSCSTRTFSIVRNAQQAAAGATPWERLTASTDALVQFQIGDQGPLLQYMALTAVPVAIRTGLTDALDTLAVHVAGTLSDGAVDGTIRIVDAAIGAQLVLGGIHAAADLPRWAGATSNAGTATDFSRAIVLGVLAPA
jgi:AcrR family transcriptional regulator